MTKHSNSLVTLAAICMIATLAIGVPDEWSWTGNGNSNNWNNDDNWDLVSGSSTDNYPGHNENSTAEVTINLNTPRAVVTQNVGSLKPLIKLFVGDGHTLDADNDITIVNALAGSDPNDPQGGLFFEGDVELDGAGKITADYIQILSEREDTVVEYTGTGSTDLFIETNRD